MKKLETFYPAFKLTFMVVLSVVTLSFVQRATEGPISEQARIRERQQIALLLPGAEIIENIDITDDAIIRYARVLSGSGEFLGYAVTSFDFGYGGAIEVMTAFESQKNIVGVSVLSHRETPGLGTGILTERFLSQFLAPVDNFTVVRGASNSPDEITALASATISTRAVVVAVNAAKNFMTGLD